MLSLVLSLESSESVLSCARLALIAEAIEQRVWHFQGIVSLSTVDDEAMRLLNREYRGIDTTTDVLSFHYAWSEEMRDPTIPVGDLVFSEAKIISQALIHGHSQQCEAEILTIHGLLHILGHDHEEDWDFERMWQFESLLRSDLGLSLDR